MLSAVQVGRMQSCNCSALLCRSIFIILASWTLEQLMVFLCGSRLVLGFNLNADAEAGFQVISVDLLQLN